MRGSPAPVRLVSKALPGQETGEKEADIGSFARPEWPRSCHKLAAPGSHAGPEIRIHHRLRELCKAEDSRRDNQDGAPQSSSRGAVERVLHQVPDQGARRACDIV